MTAQHAQRLCLSLPYSILAEPDLVRLVAGEDHRYTLRAPSLHRWLPALLKRLDGTVALDDLVGTLEPPLRQPARELLERLYSERVLTAAAARDAHRPLAVRLEAEGDGRLMELLQGRPSSPEALPLRVLCQDRLDFEALIAFNRRCLDGNAPWLWASYGAQTRGYVSPVFLPQAGPCLECLLGHFQRLSPAPEIYAHLRAHVREGGVLEPAVFPRPALEMLAQWVIWKSELLALAQPPSALYRLHVLETATLEVSAHRLLLDPECPACQGKADGSVARK